MLKIACKDKLHEPYRSRLIEDYDKIIDLCNDSGALGVFLSGAGPTIMILLEEKNTQFYKNIKGLLKNLKKVWKFKELHMDLKGAIAKEY